MAVLKAVKNAFIIAVMIKNNEFFCLEELIQRYNEKYNIIYRIVNNDKFEKAKELLDEC